MKRPTMYFMHNVPCKPAADVFLNKDIITTLSLLFSDKRTDLAKTTRSAKTGRVEVPLRGGDTFVTHAAHVWNGSAPLRQATTKAKAKKVASDFASQIPL
jgi:hypothetical protein